MKIQTLLFLASLFAAQFGLATQIHLPSGFCPEVVDYTHYSLCYDSEHRQAAWVKYKLTPELITGKQKRTNDYRADWNIEDPVLSSDYKGSGFDRGHLLPAADMKLDHTSMSETFFMTNMSPQNPSFNRRIWASIERRVRSLVGQYGVGHVITAGILEPGLPKLSTDVSIPDWYFKVIYFPESEVMKAFLIENKPHSNVFYGDFLVTVDEVEQMTGLDFFTDLPDSIEAHLEAELVEDVAQQ